jgi:hypothetical protein
METNFNGLSNPEDLDAAQAVNQPQENAEAMDAQSQEIQEGKKRVRHEDHHVNWKYKLFSNHSSYGDSPHTNTSF